MAKPKTLYYKTWAEADAKRKELGGEARVVEYGRGFAVQLYRSGPYVEKNSAAKRYVVRSVFADGRSAVLKESASRAGALKFAKAVRAIPIGGLIELTDTVHPGEGVVWESAIGRESFAPGFEGYRRNPLLMTMGNPGPRGRLMGTDVLAVVYRHKEDGKLYCHGFGDAEIKLTTRGDALTITALKEWTGVRMFALPDGSISISKPNGRIWEDM